MACYTSCKWFNKHLEQHHKLKTIGTRQTLSLPVAASKVTEKCSPNMSGAEPTSSL